MLNCEKQNSFPKRSTFNELGQQLSSIKHFGSADAILKYNSRGKKEPHFKCVCGFNFTECFSSNSPQRSVSRRQSNNHISWSWGDWLRHASCRNISHTHKHMPAWLTSQSQSGLIWLCVNVCVCSEQRWVYLFIYFPIRWICTKCKRVVFVACWRFKTAIKTGCLIYLPSCLWAPEVHFPIRRICSLFKVFTLTFSIFHSKHVASNSLKLYVWTNSQTQVSKCLHKYV